MRNEITWIECDGGPHILIEGKYLTIWKGETEEAFEQAKEYYERTALIEDYIGELSIGEGTCLIINEEFTASTWISDNNTSGFLVGVNYVSDDYSDEKIKVDMLLDAFRQIPEEQFTDTGITYQVTDEELYLFAACDYGEGWLYNYCKIKLTQGIYCIRMMPEYILDGSSFILFQFVRDILIRKGN